MYRFLDGVKPMPIGSQRNAIFKKGLGLCVNGFSNPEFNFKTLKSLTKIKFESQCNSLSSEA